METHIIAYSIKDTKASNVNEHKNIWELDYFS